MKFNQLIFVFLLSTFLVLHSPYDPVRSDASSLWVAPDSLSITTGEFASCTISGGSPPYIATAVNGNVIVAVEESRLSVGGSLPGPDTILVRDRESNTVQVEVRVRDLPTDYYSPYNRDLDFYYCTDSTCDGTDYCENDYFMCPIDMPNRKCETLRGYDEINNIENSVVLCGKKYANGTVSPCEDKESVSLRNIAEGTSGRFPPDASRVERIRFFVPKGTKSIMLRFDCYWGYDVAVVARWGQPPDCDRCSQIKSESDYINFDFDDMGGPTFADLKERDVYQRNNGAYIPVFGGRLSSLEESGWIYVYAFYREISDVIWKYSYSVEVDKADYLEWYNKCDAGKDWDEEGNPPYRVGAQEGIVNQNVPLNQRLYMVLNTSNRNGDLASEIAQEWLVFWTQRDGELTPRKFYKPRAGMIDFDTAPGTPEASAYPCSETSNSSTFQIIRISLADLGMAKGDQLFYGYAYSKQNLESFTETDFDNPGGTGSRVIFDNFVTLTAE